MPKVLTIDIETRPNLAYVWGLWDQNVGLSQLVEAGSVICFAAKWHGKSKVEFYSDHHDGHGAMIEHAHRLLSEADVVIGFNSEPFDIKHLHREFVLAGMPPPAPHRPIDLLRTVRQRFRFTSNKLDHVATELGLGSKVKHSGFQLWVDCMADDPKAWKQIRTYCKNDVVLTERLYDYLRPWIKNHPHMGLYTGKVSCCPNCGSDNMVDRIDPYMTPTAAYNAKVCEDCGAHARTPWRTATTQTRSI
jgi:DNA polymerase elongation subunit (family B)